MLATSLDEIPGQRLLEAGHVKNVRNDEFDIPEHVLLGLFASRGIGRSCQRRSVGLPRCRDIFILPGSRTGTRRILLRLLCRKDHGLCLQRGHVCSTVPWSTRLATPLNAHVMYPCRAPKLT